MNTSNNFNNFHKTYRYCLKFLLRFCFEIWIDFLKFDYFSNQLLKIEVYVLSLITSDRIYI